MRATDAARTLIASASRIVVFTGAGVSADSGIPTFRDALTGLWARFEPERLATEGGFAADPALVWRWYASRREAVRACEPNAGHRAITRLQARTPTTVITQNVDGLHARAGTADPVELHGNLERVKCFAGCGWSGTAAVIEAVDPRVPPRCPLCDAHVRPDVVWFGEMLSDVAWSRAKAACRDADLCLVVGSSGLVYPAARLPDLARQAGASLVIVGPEPSALDDLGDVVVRGRAGEVLPAMVG